jgi:hypothetical protein
MFNVQSFRCSGQAESHMSSAAGLESGPFNPQETVPFWCSFIQGFGEQQYLRTRLRNLVSFFDESGSAGGGAEH